MGGGQSKSLRRKVQYQVDKVAAAAEGLGRRVQDARQRLDMSAVSVNGKKRSRYITQMEDEIRRFEEDVRKIKERLNEKKAQMMYDAVKIFHRRTSGLAKGIDELNMYMFGDQSGRISQLIRSLDVKRIKPAMMDDTIMSTIASLRSALVSSQQQQQPQQITRQQQPQKDQSLSQEEKESLLKALNFIDRVRDEKLGRNAKGFQTKTLRLRVPNAKKRNLESLDKSIKNMTSALTRLSTKASPAGIHSHPIAKAPEQDRIARELAGMKRNISQMKNARTRLELRSKIDELLRRLKNPKNLNQIRADTNALKVRVSKKSN